MAVFCVSIENEFCDQDFLFEADDFISAVMMATEFTAQLDRKAAEKAGSTDLRPTTIKSVEDTGALWATEQGLQEFMENVVIYQEEDD